MNIITIIRRKVDGGAMSNYDAPDPFADGDEWERPRAAPAPGPATEKIKRAIRRLGTDGRRELVALLAIDLGTLHAFLDEPAPCTDVTDAG